MSKQQIIFIKGSITDYNESKMQGAVYFAEDKKKIIVDGAEYGLDLESDEVDLISNIEHKDNKLTITFSNGKTKEIELENHRTYWEELEVVNVEEFPKGGCIINTHPINEFSFKGSGNKGKWYSSDGQEDEYTASDTTITFKEEGEYTLKFVNNYEDGYNGLTEVTDNSVKSVLMIGGSSGETRGVNPVDKNENAKLIFYNNITSIESYAFDGCSGFIGELKLPESVTSIGNYTFRDCSGFTGDLIIPEGVTSIGDAAFLYCTGFTGDLKLPESITSIGGGAFYDCSGFTGDLIIPEGVTSIGRGAFYDCKGLSRIYVCEDTELGDLWNTGTLAEVIKYKKGETPWITEKK